ncbi:MAG: MBL fold metallo-hydrolase [Acidobacteriota bacterium]
MAELYFLGATKTVTGSKYVLSVDGTKVMLDCGLFQGLKELRLRNWEALPTDITSLDAVILTHAHIDHTGYLPRLVRQGYQGPVYASVGTTELCKILLPDSGRLQEEDARFANKMGFSKHHPALPLYTEKDAKAALRLFRSFQYEQQVALSPAFSFRFISAGHILGSSFIYITLKEGERETTIVFSGDLGRYDVPILNDPTPVLVADYIVVESTYGNRLHDPISAKQQLAEVVIRTAARGGRLVIPAFAVGRTQEILYYLRELETEQRIPVLPVILDSPMAQSAMHHYLHNREDQDIEMRELIDKHINPLTTKAFRIGGKRGVTALTKQSKPCIVISASGMATGGRVLHHLKECLPDPRSTVLFAGFQAQGTRGRRLLEGEPTIKIHGEIIPVRAEIASISNLSAHADYAETLRWLSAFHQAPRRVFVTHGEPDAAQALKEKIETKFGWSVTVPDYRDRFPLFT